MLYAFATRKWLERSLAPPHALRVVATQHSEVRLEGVRDAQLARCRHPLEDLDRLPSRSLRLVVQTERDTRLGQPRQVEAEPDRLDEHARQLDRSAPGLHRPDVLPSHVSFMCVRLEQAQP